jgi:hypothetical protein
VSHLPKAYRPNAQVSSPAAGMRDSFHDGEIGLAE